MSYRVKPYMGCNKITSFANIIHGKLPDKIMAILSAYKNKNEMKVNILFKRDGG